MFNLHILAKQSRCLFSSKTQLIKPVLNQSLLKSQFLNSRSYFRNILYQKTQPAKDSSDGPKHNIGNDNFKTKYVLISAGSLLFAGSLYAVLFTDTFKQKKSGELEPEQKKVIRIPADSKDIPKQIPYLLVGGGTASFSAFRAIKSNDPTAKVLVISNELYYPYMRTPLSKEIWFQEDKDVLEKLNFRQWYGAERSLFYEPEDFYIDCDKLENQPKGGIAIAKGWTVSKIDPSKKTAYLDDGSEIKYEKCLIATGVSPKKYPAIEKARGIHDKVTLFRSIDDFKRLYKAVHNGAKTIAIIGGSFLGSELACSLSTNGSSNVKIIQIYPEKGNLAKILPAYLSSWTTEKIREQNIEIFNNSEIDEASLSLNKKQVKLKLSNGQEIFVDHIVVAVGSEVNDQLAKASGLEIDSELGGILVNSELSARSDVYAAGDCACFYDVQLGRRRVEHHDHAIVSGRLAGENMLGAGKIYSHQSMFWSDLGPKITFEAIGIIDSTLPTVAIYAKTDSNVAGESAQESLEKNNESDKGTNIKTSLPKDGEDYSKGVIFYLKNDLIVGIVLWNVFNGMSIARQVLKEQKKFEDLNEVAKLFNIHSNKMDSSQD